MTAPVVAAPVIAEAIAINKLLIGVNLGRNVGIGVEIIGASTLAISTSTIILASGCAAALGYAGYHLYKKHNKT